MKNLYLTTALAISSVLPVVAQDQQTSDWTVARLSEQVRATMKRFDTVVLEATYTQKRDANAFAGKEPLLVHGSGSLLYRGDQDRWFMRNDGYSFRVGTQVTRPRLTITGFDGEIHYNGDDRALTLGEEGFRRAARPRSLIWETMLTYDYLVRSFDRDSTKIVFEGVADGRKVVDLESTWGREPRMWRLWVRLATDRSFLPLSQKLWYNDKLYSESSLEEITPVAESEHWYPTIINTRFHQEALGIIEQQHAISKFLLPDAMDRDSFEYEPAVGTDIVDRRSNTAWHIDPWWNELTPWMSTELGWPRPALKNLKDLKSHADESINDQLAPSIDASNWLGEDPGDWMRKDRAFTILYFWGDASRLIRPHPQYTTTLGQFAKLIEPIGGEVIGVATSDTDFVEFQKAAKELMIEFPFAIDESVDDDKPNIRGKTHKAFKLQHYFSVLVVDSDGKVQLLGPGEGLVPTIGKLIPKADFEWLQEQLEVDARLSDGAGRRIQAKWIELRKATNGLGTISGKADPSLAGTVTLLPQFKMLLGSNPGGYRLFRHDGGRKSVEPDRQTGVFTFSDLPRGQYQLTFVAKGGQQQSTTIVLTKDDDSAIHNFDRT